MQQFDASVGAFFFSSETPDCGYDTRNGFTTMPAAFAFGTVRGSQSRSTGKERDAESGNDYFSARYYSSAMGRFMSPDWSDSPWAVPYADLDNPQTLNLYSYVQNNPLSRTDPFGHAGKDPCDGIPNCVSVTADPLPVIPLTAMFIGDGHHFFPQSLYRDASEYAKQIYSNWKTGKLPVPGLHGGRTKEHNDYIAKVKEIILKLQEKYGKNISEWGKEEVKESVKEIRAEAGKGEGAIQELLDNIEGNNPAANTVRDAVKGLEELQSDPDVENLEKEVVGLL